MTKEPGQPPKAVNIIRPNTNYALLHSTTSTSSSGSSNSGSLIYSQQHHHQQQQQQQQHKRNGTSNTNSSVLSSNRKPRVNSTAKIVEKPVLNLYHPPTRKPSYDRANSSSIISTSTTNHSSSSRPPIEIYKPQQHHFQPVQQSVQHQPQRMTKSLTAPSLTSNSESLNNANNHSSSSSSRPISPFHGRPNHRSVLGPIVTPVAATTTATNQSPTAITADHSEYNNNRSLLEGINKIVHEEQQQQQDTIVNDDVENDDNGDDDSSEQEEIETIEEEEEEVEEEEPVINEARVNRKVNKELIEKLKNIS